MILFQANKSDIFTRDNTGFKFSIWVHRKSRVILIACCTLTIFVLNVIVLSNVKNFAHKAVLDQVLCIIALFDWVVLKFILVNYISQKVVVGEARNVLLAGLL